MDAENPIEPVGWSEETSRIFINYGRYFVPEREHQMQIIASLLSSLNGPNHIIDLCCGEGLLAEVILSTFPNFTIQGLDGSVEMLNRAQKRLTRFGSRFICCKNDLGSVDWRVPDQPVNAVISSMSIHHLKESQKKQLFFDIFKMLEVNGVLIIADIVEHPNEMGKHQASEELDEVVRKRSIEIDGNTAAFDFFQREKWNMFRYLDPDDIDKPSPLFNQLKWLEHSGFSDIDVHWMLAGHAIFSARKSMKA